MKDLLKGRVAKRLIVMVIGLVVAGMLGGWLLTTSTPSKTEALLGIGLMLGVALLSIGLLKKWVFDPLWNIQKLAGQLAKRYANPLLTNSRNDEFVELERTLTQVSSQVHQRLHVLEGERARVGSIFNSMSEGIIALDEQGRILEINPSARRIFEMTQEPVEGQLLLEVVRSRELLDLVEWCQSTPATEPCRREIEVAVPQRLTLDVNVMPFLHHGRMVGVLLVFHDMTELRRLEQVRAEFVANVSHELRTPLTSIKGYLETVLDGEPDDSRTQRRFLTVALAQAERLNRLVTDLNHLSNIERGNVILHVESVLITEMVQGVFALFEEQARQRSITFVNLVSPNLMVQADRDRLSQILVNLVDNAVKWTSHGGQVTIEGERKEEKVSFCVKDTGQGIPSTELPRLTERFYRVDKARSREEGGTGLGLAIVKHLVQLHGGTLDIRSEVGKGTTVEVALPASP